MSHSRHLVDPDLLDLLDRFPSFHFAAQTLPDLRVWADRPVQTPSSADALIRARTIPTRDGHAIEVRICMPAGAARQRPVMLHMHGGGYVMGSARMMDARNMATAAALDCVIVSVDYRLAPETRHPGPIEDCYAALLWLNAHADELGIDNRRIAVGGESAGAGLAAGLALLARDRAEIGLIHQHLLYPMLDDRTCRAPQPHPFAGEFIWTASHNEFGWTSLLGEAPGGDNLCAYAAPARSENLAGLPPAFLSVGALDLFLQENIEYARRLIRAGVPTEIHVYPGVFHGADVNAPNAPSSLDARRDSLDALRKAFR